LDDCSKHVQAVNFPSATVLSCRESNSHRRSGRDTDKTVLSCLVWPCELAAAAAVAVSIDGRDGRTTDRYIVPVPRTVAASIITHTHTHTHTHTFTPVSPYQNGKTKLDFTEARDSEWQRHQLGHMQVCTSLQTDNHASTPPLSFYRPDALPAAQPTASQH